MKKLVTIFLILISLGSFGQLLPIAPYRVQNNTTVLGIDLPVGSTIFDVFSSDYYIVTNASGVDGTKTIGGNMGSLSKIGSLWDRHSSGLKTTLNVGIGDNPILSYALRVRTGNSSQTAAMIEHTGVTGKGLLVKSGVASQPTLELQGRDGTTNFEFRGYGAMVIRAIDNSWSSNSGTGYIFADINDAGKLKYIAEGITYDLTAGGGGGGGMVNPMVSTGDMIISNSGSAPSRLGIGSANQVLTVVSGKPAWANATSGSSQWDNGTYGISYGSHVGIGSAALQLTALNVSKPVSNYIANLHNSSSTGMGLLVNVVSSSSDKALVNFMSGGTQTFSINAAGQIYMTKIPLQTQTHVLGYNPSTNEVTYQLAPTGGTGDLQVASNSVLGGFKTGFSQIGNSFPVSMSGERAYTSISNATYTSPGISSYNINHFSLSGSKVFIKGSAIGIPELKANTATNGYVLSANTSTGGFTWVPQSSGGSFPLGGSFRIPFMNIDGNAVTYDVNFNYDNFLGVFNAPTVQVGYRAYGTSWAGSLRAPTERAVYEKIQSMGSGSGVNFGSSTQIPFMNSGGTDFLYNSGFNYNTSTTTLSAQKVKVTNQVYSPSWDGNVEVPTKDALFDKIESLAAGSSKWTTASNGIYNTGNVGIGGQPTSGYILSVSGTASVTGTLLVPFIQGISNMTFNQYEPTAPSTNKGNIYFKNNNKLYLKDSGGNIMNLTNIPDVHTIIFDMDFQVGAKGTRTIANNNDTISILNLPNGAEGQIDINCSGSGNLVLKGSTGYTNTKLMGAKTRIKAGTTLANKRTTLVFWRTENTLYYGYIHEN